jgi:choline dehydrogenase-like flavoprotein
MADRQAKARVVVLAASALETARLLLNSKSAKHPQGLANSSGTVGKYITDTTGAGVSGYVPAMENHAGHNEDGAGGMHVYMPWWLDNRKLDFPRGYHIEVGGGVRQPGAGFMGGIHNYPPGGGYGVKLKEDYRRYYGATISLEGRGEMIPNDDSYCEIDPAVVDRFGIPVLRFHWKWTDAEYNQAKHMQETFRSIISALGGTPLSEMPAAEQDFGLEAPGRIIHECGTTRMGKDPARSVLNEWCQAHEAGNVFVCDGGPFVSQADKNATWTILALAMRTSEYIAEQSRQGAL